MKTYRTSQYVLGITATSRAVQAVLLQPGPDGPETLRRFSRQRTRGAAASPSAVPTGMPEVPAEPAGTMPDFTIQFGDKAGGSDLFLASEFGVVEKEAGDESTPASAPVVTFELELRDILDECRDAGYDSPVVAFALAAGDASYVEVRVPEAPKGRKVDDTYLAELLTQQYKGLFDENRVTFLPMTPGEEGGERYLAVFPKQADPVTATLRSMREAKERMPMLRLIDAEVPLYVGLARRAQHHLLNEPTGGEAPDEDAPFEFAPPVTVYRRPAEGQPLHTLVVRAGTEETLVLFLKGETIHHCENLRSLTAFDAPETVCSRVLLQQDEHGLGEVHNVLIVSEEREPDLIETFEMFFPDARVESMRDYVPRSDDAPGGSAIVSSTAAALRLIGDPDLDDVFPESNFLPRKLAARRVRLPFTWHMAALSVMVVFTSIFFVVSYSSGAQEIDAYRARVSTFAEEEVTQDIETLQAQIDSMQALHATYTRALQVLDTLLVGSDRWSRALDKASREAATVKGVWIESMSPEGTGLHLAGTATSRDRIVALAERLDATIATLTFSEIREWPVYTFNMQMEVPDELPAAARYLREHVVLTPPDSAETSIAQ